VNDWAAPPSADRVPTLTEVVDLTAPALDIGPELDAPAWPEAGAREDDPPPVQGDAGATPGSEQEAEVPESTAPAQDAVQAVQQQAWPGEGQDLLCDASNPPHVVVWEGIDAPGADTQAAGPLEAGQPASAIADVAPAIDTTAVVALALAELQPRLDMLLESRLREALAPALARAAEGLIRDARGELASAMNELLQDAVRRALQRQAAHAPGADTGPPHRP
jgi:hypothetical protein